MISLYTLILNNYNKNIQLEKIPTKMIGAGALSSEMLLVMIVRNNKIDNYSIRTGYVN